VDTEAEPDWRWIEADPWGLAIHCAEGVWRAKAQQHPEIAAYEAEIRATVRGPDRVYFDPRSTAMLQPEGEASGVVLHYVGVNRTHGIYARSFVDVIVKVLRTPSTGAVAGYFQSAFLPRVLHPRLQLRWSR